MRIAILLAALTIAVMFITGNVASNYGPLVAARFLERDMSYSAGDVRHFVQLSEDDARHYVVPILFPFDLLFMVVFGGFLAAGAMSLGADAGVPNTRLWLLAVVPAAYVFFDFAEDISLAGMLADPSRLDTLIKVAKPLTLAKIATSGLGIGQTIVIASIAAVQSRKRPADQIAGS